MTKQLNYYMVKISRYFVLIVIVSLAWGRVYSQSLPFQEALEEAASSDKRIIVDIYTDWCGWCKKMDKDVYGNKKIKKIVEKDFIVAKLDAEGMKKIKFNGTEYTETDLAVYFEASGYPTTVFLEPDGKVIEYKYKDYVFRNLPGYFNADEFKKMLVFIRDGKYKDTDLSKIF